MPSWLKHTLTAVAGAACVVGGVFFPPAAVILGPLGTKLIITAGAAALTGVSPEVLTDAVKGLAQGFNKR